ncbi:hypothetical protein MF6396_16845 [Pseudomonas sp. MF6396]|nr:hypothetical protein MF6396_16845 [Pseudomonas sp. MF6396]
MRTLFEVCITNKHQITRKLNGLITIMTFFKITLHILITGINELQKLISLGAIRIFITIYRRPEVK